MSNHPKFIVVIGTSAGGLNALVELVRNLPKNLDAAYCIVQHLSRKGIGDFVVHRLEQFTSIPCSLVTDGASIERDNIYIARPNQHLLVKDGKFFLGAGPEENRFRPSIDVLFRSAAVGYSSCTIGIILSGLLDDGTSGMWAIKRCGGACIVQDPNQAEFPEMPLSVMNNMEVDHVVNLSDIGPLIEDIIENSKGEKIPIPEDILKESRIAEKTAVGIDDVKEIGEQSIFACPDCGGGLWTMKNDVITRYRCHIGHSYTENDLIVKQAQAAGTTLWVALRMMEERKHLLRKMEIDNKSRGFTHWAEANVEKQDEMEGHINKLKEILHDLQNHDTA
jgi:two-component system, chemotaxis family, protein-glutamate methylesterase/glutaminase